MDYDPLIAKLITHGETREQATARMSTALNEFYIRGVAHHISFLSAAGDTLAVDQPILEFE